MQRSEAGGDRRAVYQRRWCERLAEALIWLHGRGTATSRSRGSRLHEPIHARLHKGRSPPNSWCASQSCGTLPGLHVPTWRVYDETGGAQ